MSKKRMVIALGHKDLGVNLPQQKEAVAKTAVMIADFIESGYQIAIVFSNGPQVGMIHTAMSDLATNYQDKYTKTPLSVCSAMSQGFIGYDLQNAIRAELVRRGIFKTVSTILTQVMVDPYDESFYEPVKFVGKFMNETEAKKEEEQGNPVAKLEDGTYRRIVPSPTPKSIVEIEAVKALLDADQIVIAAGGGGIPVMQQGSHLRGASAVIEKDFAAGLLAKEVDADVLLITTSVDAVALEFGSDHERKLNQMFVVEAEKYLNAGQFEEHTMLPKVAASVDFVKSGNGRKAVITSMECAEKALCGEAGTTIL